MNAKQAIRKERDEVREKRDRLLARASKLDGEAKALDDALRVLEARKNGPAPSTGRRKKRTYHGTIPMEKRVEEIRELLRNEYPGKEITAHEIRVQHRIPHASAENALEALVTEGSVKRTREAVRKPGAKRRLSPPAYTYVGTTVHAGEGVRS